LFTLKNNGEKEVEVSTQRNEEEVVNIEAHKIEVEIVHNINLDRCETFIHALTWLSLPQTLKIVGYIKKKNVVVIIDSGSTHNFIDKILEELLDCFVYPMTNFQVLVRNGGVLIMWENETTLN
jgi:carbamoylphosphate synthase small subunit